MAGARITIDANTQPVLEALNALLRKTGDLRPAFEDIGEYLLRSHDERWAEEQAPDGTPWAPLSPDYAARKPKNQGKILVLEGYLKDSLDYQTTSRELLFGVSLGVTGEEDGYAATHQFGDEDRGIPARPFLGVSPADEVEILEIVRGFLED